MSGADPIGSGDFTPHERSWPQLAWMGCMWTITNATASFGTVGWRLAGFISTSVLVVLVLVWLYATQRLADSQRQLIAAYKDECDLAGRTIDALNDEVHRHRTELSRYRRAFTYAKKVGEGMDPKQAGIEANRPQGGAE